MKKWSKIIFKRGRGGTSQKRSAKLSSFFPLNLFNCNLWFSYSIPNMQMNILSWITKLIAHVYFCLCREGGYYFPLSAISRIGLFCLQAQMWHISHYFCTKCEECIMHAPQHGLAPYSLLFSKHTSVYFLQLK